MKQTILRLLIEDVEKNLERFEQSTGRFLTGDGWAVTNQDIIFSLALLYSTPSSDNPYHQNARILDFAKRGGDALRDFQNPDGTVEFVKVDGSTWGPIYMPWSMYHWLEAYGLIKEILEPGRENLWRSGLTLAYRGIAEEIKSAEVHNIPAWNAMALYRAGQLFAETDWMVIGARMIDRTVAAQMPEGYWKEHGGPTPLYNLVYLHALGLYHAFSGDTTVLPAIERTIGFHIKYTYPDGSLVETVDGRVKYHDRVPDFGFQAFSLTPRGRRFAARLLSEKVARRERGSDGPGLNPRLASAYQHAVEGSDESIEVEREVYRIGDAGVGIVRRGGDWVYALSECVTNVVEERWGQDRQNFISVWNRRTGLIVGTGNSKNQPEWSTGIVRTGQEQSYVPTGASIESKGLMDCLTLDYDRIIIRVLVGILDDGDVEICFAREGEPDVQVVGQLMFRLEPGGDFTTAGCEPCKVGESPIAVDAREGETWFGSSFENAGWRADIPAGATVAWPVRPFNPYAADGAAALDSAVAVLSIPLDGESGLEKRVRLRIDQSIK